MGMFSARLFTWLQRADFYRDLHNEAVEQLPVGDGAAWLDIGCGPGLVARLVSRRGYQAVGIDSDPHMVRAAEAIARRERSSARFMVGGMRGQPRADVVSAASLLAVLGDPGDGLRVLWESVKPGGTLLVVEPTPEMTVRNANAIIGNGLPGRGKNLLRLWAFARQGRAVPPGIAASLPAGSMHLVPLLNGLAQAWVIRKLCI
ncbi:MAG: class I SAM-dependent methyltransferase [Nitrospinae bacterium]|nr:class I SAM-dependent methyltransferase [Nitrospinota bacterium]